MDKSYFLKFSIFKKIFELYKTKNDKFLLNNKDDVLIMYRTLLKIIP